MNAEDENLVNLFAQPFNQHAVTQQWAQNHFICNRSDLLIDKFKNIST